MNLGLLKYSEIINYPLTEIVILLAESSKLNYGSIKLTDLVINSKIEDLKISEYYSPQFFGKGIYIFFDGDIPVYVGKADNFLHRLSSHRIIDPRPNWGWNALLNKICVTRLGIVDGHTVADYNTALEIMEKFQVIRILVDVEFSSNQLSKLERIIMKGIQHDFGSLLNGKIGKVNDSFMFNNLSNFENS